MEENLTTKEDELIKKAKKIADIENHLKKQRENINRLIFETGLHEKLRPIREGATSA